jgi:hydrogenase maturation protease
MMRALLIGIGNPLRRDDGVAQAVLDLLGGSPGIDLLPLHQLTPEIASECAGYDPVIVIDADVSASVLKLRSLPDGTGMLRKAFTHAPGPEDIVAIARSVFGFRGRAFLCRIPVSDLEVGAGLTPHAQGMAHTAAKLIRQFVAGGSGIRGTAKIPFDSRYP